MPTDRRERHSGEGREGQNGGSPALGQQVWEGAEQAGQRLREGYGAARDELDRRYHWVEGRIARNPAPSVLISFGVGVGLGLVLTTLLVRGEETWGEWSQRQAHEGARRARHTMGHAQDTMRHVPEAFHTLAESIRGLSEAVARHLPSGMQR